MANSKLCYLSATEMKKAYCSGKTSPVEVMRAIAHRCHEANSKVNAFTYTFFDRAIDLAKEAESTYSNSSGDIRLLEGIPIAVKDNTAVKGEITTYGSRIFAGHRPDHSHPGLKRLLDAGAIMIARTTMSEFGEAATCHSPLWGVTRNPWNLEYGPGGSSGGAAAAVAAGMTTLADGSDIGGSIRIPAACCGVIGYKPPYGRNPNNRLNRFDPYQHYGPITRTVRDAALMQNVVSGVHVDDISTLRQETRIPDRLRRVNGWKISYSIDLGYYQVDNDVHQNLLQVMDIFRDLKCEVEEVDLGWSSDIFDAWKIINASRGAAARHMREHGHRDVELADYTRDWLETGKQITMDQTTWALEIHEAMYEVVGSLLERYDIIVCPTNAIPSVEADRSPLDLDIRINGEPARPEIAEAWFMTHPFNMLSQLPVMSIPSGFSSCGVPTGIQIIGRSYDDIRVFRAARALERELKWHLRRPPI